VSGHVPGVERIGVLRANALGDFIFTLPALDALRAAYPAAEIVLLGRAWHEGFLSGRPGPIDRVIPVPEGSLGDETDGELREEERDAFLERLRSERFDVALQMHGGGRHSNPFVASIGAGLTVGARADDAPALDRTVPYFYWQPEIGRYLEIVSLVGATPVTLEPRVEVLPSDVGEAAARIGLGGEPVVVMHPGARDTRRRWPAEKFAHVGRALAERGARVVVTGDETERELAREVAEAAGAQDVAGVLSLRGLAGLLSRAALVISNDTGPLHLALAVGGRAVSIYWCGNLINSSGLTRASHRPIAAWRLECPTCGVNCMTGACEHRESFVADVRVEDVLDAAVSLMCARPQDGR
jgi:ADP-heptose:LPS heptosyltransferase